VFALTAASTGRAAFALAATPALTGAAASRSPSTFTSRSSSDWSVSPSTVSPTSGSVLPTPVVSPTVPAVSPTVSPTASAVPAAGSTPAGLRVDIAARSGSASAVSASSSSGDRPWGSRGSAMS
jgi:hypothetical protein